jgi:hypothetical protein
MRFYLRGGTDPSTRPHREMHMFTYKMLTFAVALALITSLSAPSVAAPFYYSGSPSCVEDNGFGPYAGHC